MSLTLGLGRTFSHATQGRCYLSESSVTTLVCIIQIPWQRAPRPICSICRFAFYWIFPPRLFRQVQSNIREKETDNSWRIFEERERPNSFIRLQLHRRETAAPYLNLIASLTIWYTRVTKQAPFRPNFCWHQGSNDPTRLQGSYSHRPAKHTINIQQ